MRATPALSAVEERYRHVLRAYPEEWLDRNGEALVGMLLDRTDAEGRSAPTLREVADLTMRGLRARMATTENVELRRRVASIAAGLGVAFALVSFGLFIAPDGLANSDSVPASGATIVLAAWVLFAATTTARLGVVWRALALTAIVMTPVTLLVSLRTPGDGYYIPIDPLVRPPDAVFFVGLALLTASGSLDRRLMMRVTAIAVPAFGLGFLIASGSRDPYDQTLWGSLTQASSGAPGTLQMLWSDGGGPMPLVGDHRQSFDELFRLWAQSSVLRLRLLPVGMVLVAIVLAILLLRGRKRVAGRTLVALSLPFVVALTTAATQTAGIWFR